MNLNNNWQGIGRLGADPDLRQTSDGRPMARFRMATEFHYTDKNGERQKQVTWITVYAFGKKAELVSQLLSKGKRTAVSGPVQINEYIKDDERREMTYIRLDQFQILDSARTERPWPADDEIPAPKEPAPAKKETKPEDEPPDLSGITTDQNLFSNQDDLPF